MAAANFELPEVHFADSLGAAHFFYPGQSTYKLESLIHSLVENPAKFGKSHQADNDCWLLWEVLKCAVKNAHGMRLSEERVMMTLGDFFLYYLRSNIEFAPVPHHYEK